MCVDRQALFRVCVLCEFYVGAADLLVFVLRVCVVAAHLPHLSQEKIPR